MRTEELKEYLGIVVDMERNIFLQNKLASNLQKQLKELQTPQVFVDPVMPALPEKAEIQIGMLIGMPIFMFVRLFWIPILIASILAVGSSIVFTLLPLLPIDALFPFIIVLSYGGFVVFLVKFSFDEHIAKPREAYNKAMSKYNCEMKKYQQTTAQNIIKRHQDESDRIAKTDFLKRELSQVESFLKVSQKHLQAIYSKNIIFPKYRSLTAVCSLYEYICAGRCNTLDGRDGAYNIYEGEARLDRIITQLDRVIANLDAIRDNQFILYSAIQDMNQRSALILESTQNMAGQLHILNGQTGSVSQHITELQKASSLTAYHAERTQKELAYMNRMDYFSGRNDEVFFNHPPV